MVAERSPMGDGLYMAVEQYLAFDEDTIPIVVYR